MIWLSIFIFQHFLFVLMQLRISLKKFCILRKFQIILWFIIITDYGADWDYSYLSSDPTTVQQVVLQFFVSSTWLKPTGRVRHQLGCFVIGLKEERVSYFLTKTSPSSYNEQAKPPKNKLREVKKFNFHFDSFEQFRLMAWKTNLRVRCVLKRERRRFCCNSDDKTLLNKTVKLHVSTNKENTRRCVWMISWNMF